MMHQYKESLQDLFTLLKLEPNNTAAKKEVEIVKKYYKEVGHNYSIMLQMMDNYFY